MDGWMDGKIERWTDEYIGRSTSRRTCEVEQNGAALKHLYVAVPQSRDLSKRIRETIAVLPVLVWRVLLDEEPLDQRRAGVAASVELYSH